jgi:type IV secretion system protein TrbL
MAGGAYSAYGLASAGKTGASGVAAGLGGVGRAAAAAAVSPLRRAADRATSAVKDSFAAGARSSFAATGGSSTMGTVGGAKAATEGGTGPDASGLPAWAQRLKRNQAMTRGAEITAHAVKSGDSHGGGHSVDLSGGE